MEVEYKYRAINADNDLVTGFRSAPDEISLNRILLQERLRLISVERVSRFRIKKLLAKLGDFSRISEHDKIIMYRNLGSMLSAGLSLARAISVMYRQTTSKVFRKILGKIDESIKKGSSLSEAFRQFPRIFNPLVVSMVKSGEETGNLAKSLRVTAEQMEKTYLLKKKIRGAMIYPGFIILAIFVVGIFMMIYVVPVLTDTFNELEIELPMSTRAIISISDFLQNNLLGVAVGILILAALVIWFLRTKSGKRVFDSALIKAPGLSPMIKEINSARVARAMSSLLSAGVPVVRALEISKDIVQNSYYKQALEGAAKNIGEGLLISKIFAENKDLFPTFVSEMVSVGEETGELGGMLNEVAVFYEAEVDQKIKNISAIIEPALMIVVGVAVGFFALSMIGPIYSLSEGI
ncbi:MAG TPA: type II secretion system F family protein [Candidatus Paceibacterota bacterium]|nr:type II secretion system F family protein [Candidatus Paceibacterota bacterium]HRZ34268.1 type II secretion system F family protein [Candidatus Paceibacterota bacterium]